MLRSAPVLVTSESSPNPCSLISSALGVEFRCWSREFTWRYIMTLIFVQYSGSNGRNVVLKLSHTNPRHLRYVGGR